MKKIPPAGFVFGALVALFFASPTVTLAQGLTVSGYADFEAAVENIDADDKEFYFDNHHFNLIKETLRVASLIDVAPAVKDPGDLFKSRCAACHGETGAGDGIAAVAYNPKPTNFTSAEWAAARTADQVEAVITNGFNAMPPFAAMLSAGEIKDLAAYLRQMSRNPAG